MTFRKIVNPLYPANEELGEGLACREDEEPIVRTLGVPAQVQRDRVVRNSDRLETTMIPHTGHGYNGSGTVSEKDAHGFTTRTGSDPHDPLLSGERGRQDCV